MIDHQQSLWHIIHY